MDNKMTTKDLVEALSEMEIIDKTFFVAEHPEVESVFWIGSDEKYLRCWDIILEEWGSNFVTIVHDPESSVSSGDLVEIAGKFCPNLENITILVKEDSVQKVADNLPFLKMLKMVTVINEEVNLAGIFMSLQFLENLRRLKVDTAALSRDEVTQLNEVIQLEELDVPQMNSDNFNYLPTLLGNLCVLKIVKCDGIIPYCPKLIHLKVITGLDDSSIRYLDSEYNDQLQVLNIGPEYSTEEVFERIADLRALKHLILDKTPSNAIDVLVSMSLEEITALRLEPIEILRLVKESSSLKALTCDSHDIEFLPQLLDILEAKGFQPDEPFKLKITTETEQSIPSLPNSNLLSLELIHFDP